jgi:hypothetical protein
LGANNPDLEVVNFAVDGYSMAQAYLRYLSVRTALQHNLVLLMFVPAADLWRDVNIRRDMGEDWWGYFFSMPRFIVENGDLRLVRPYPSVMNFQKAEFTPGLVASLKTYLGDYDRFYDPRVYELPELLQYSLIYRLLLLNHFNHSRQSFRDSLWAADSEARLVSREIFAAMNGRVKEDGGHFYLVMLPTLRELRENAKNVSIKDWYDGMCESLVGSGIDCLNLLDGLARVPMSQLDLAFDNAHYGPKANREIARLIEKHLRERGWINGVVAGSIN